MNLRILAASFVVAASLTAQLSADDAPWDFDVPPSVERSSEGSPSLAYDLFSSLVQLYRDNKEGTSIHRCIFQVSCSHFAERAFSKHGLLVGAVVLIDRYFYRENAGAREFYPLAGEPNGTYRLDDTPFVP